MFFLPSAAASFPRIVAERQVHQLGWLKVVVRLSASLLFDQRMTLFLQLGLVLGQVPPFARHLYLALARQL